MASVQIPPWLNIDPIEPARIAERSRARRATADEAARRTALAEQQLIAQQQMAYARIAAGERAAQARDELLRQTREGQMAQQAEALGLRREMGQRQAMNQMQALRLRQQKVENEAASAARRMQGMRQVQEALNSGMSLEQALAQNAELFSDRPERLATAMRAARPAVGSIPLGPEAYTARDIMNAQGQPTGMLAIPGQRSARLLPGQRRQLSPEGEIRRLTKLAEFEQKKSETGRTKAEREAAALKRDEYVKQMENFGIPRVPGKEDEREVAPGEEEDFLLPPTEMPVDEEEALAEEEIPLDEEELAADEEEEF